MTTKNRTAKGTVTATARKQYGNQRGAFPIFDKQSALAALKLRGHAQTPAERASVITRAAKFVPAAAAKAREADKGKKK